MYNNMDHKIKQNRRQTMKRILSLILVLVLSLTCLAACGDPDNTDPGNTPPADDGVRSYNLAIGVTAAANADFSKVIKNVAVLVTDADGKIVLCRLDCVEYSGDSDDAPVSKAEQGDNYDPYGAMAAGDWYKQAAALESYVAGKTRSEVAAIAVGADGKSELVAGCTIAITDLLAAIDKAFASEYKTAFDAKEGTLTAGLKVSASAIAYDEAKNQTKISTTFGAAVLSEGAVVAAILDTAEPVIKFVAEYNPTFTYDGTKREQGTSYDSYAPMAAGTWYVQADAYAKAAVGLTKDNIATLASEGVAGCTIYAGGYKAAIEAAVNMAR